MASLKETKRRIVSVNSTQKITRAMKLVASAKYAKSQSRLQGFGVYREKFTKVLSAVSAKQEHLLLQSEDKVRRNLLIIVSSDRGLCGPLNTGVFREVENFLEEQQGFSWELETWGKKARQFTQRRSEKVVFTAEKVSEKPSFEFARSGFLRAYQGLKDKKYNKVYLAYPSFKNIMSQPPIIKELLPLSGVLQEFALASDSDVLLEPERAQMLEPMLKSFASCYLYGVLLEVCAAENAARMTAMDSATSNADKVIKELTLEYNRARQAAITKELIEITSGVEALG